MKGVNQIGIIAFSTMLLACTTDHSSHQDSSHDHSAHQLASPVQSMSSVDDVLMLNPSQIRLANITTMSVGQAQTAESWVLNAKLVVDEDRSTVISSRAAGRVEQLMIRETGRRVSKGEPLYSLYSEEMLTLQQEFLLAAEQARALSDRTSRYARMEEAAARKLILYGLTEAQVENLRARKIANPTVTFLAPASGLITTLTIAEGQYVNEGTAVMRIESLNQLWVEADVYAHEVSRFHKGDRATVVVRGFEQEPQQAMITFVSPEYEATSQILQLRASLSNPGMRFQPGMQAEVRIQRPARSTVMLPTDAVIRESRGTHVYVQTDVGTFTPRMVTLGYEDFDEVEITSGLTKGDTVVTSGAYLLYSEFVLKKGVNPIDHLLAKNK